MNDRDAISQVLAKIEQEMKELIIRYEQYFAGVEKREPIKEREKLATLLRRFVNRRIIQTDLRFKSQNLASRFHSYGGYWDRILRLMDEGRYERQAPRAGQGGKSTAGEEMGAENAIERIYRDLIEARKACRLDGEMPSRKQLAAFIERQKESIRNKVGDRELEFKVVTENGKPKIKARAKK